MIKNSLSRQVSSFVVEYFLPDDSVLLCMQGPVIERKKKSWEENGFCGLNSQARLLMNSDTYATLNGLARVLYPIFVYWESSGGCVGSWGE